MDLEVLEKDAGLCRVLRHAETHGMRRRERRALKARWRGERWRSVPSDSVVSVLKSDLAGGRLPSRLFGANAAWWAIAVLAFNLSSAMKRLVLGGQWVSRRLKAVRFALIALPGRVMRHARRLIIRLSRDHPSYELLLRARQNILALAAEPYRA